MTFEVQFKLRVAGPGVQVHLHRNMTLPFPPTVGMLVKDGKFRCSCDEVVWDQQEEMFLVYTKDVDHSRDQKDCVFEAKEHYVPYGWQLTERY